MHISPVLDAELSPSACGGITTATGSIRDLDVLTFGDVLRHVPPQAFEKGSVIEGAYFLHVVSGLVQAYRDLPKGEQVGLGIHGPGAYLFGNDRVRVLSRSAEVMAWSRDEFNLALKRAEGPGICIAFLADALNMRTNQVVRHAHLRNDQRLAVLLLDLAHRLGTRNADGGFTIPGLSHETLALELGSTREIVTAHMIAFRSKGACYYDRKNITILPAEMRLLAEFGEPHAS